MAVERWIVHIALIVAVGLVANYAQSQSQAAERSLCTLRAAYEGNVQRSEQYLKDVESGLREPVPGITEADILSSIQNSRRTIDALSNLDCS